MTDPYETKGHEPAPWEAPGKRHTDKLGRAQAGGPPPAQPQHPAAPVPYEAAYPPPPRAPGVPQYPPPPPGAQQYAPPPPGAQYSPQQPYAHQPAMPGQYGYPPGYGPSKPTSVMAIISLSLMGAGILAGLVTVGVISAPFFLAGLVLGILALRETGTSGRKTGRGMALGGTIVNALGLAVSIVVLVALFWVVSTAKQATEQRLNLDSDTALLIDRLAMYDRLKGDLGPGGPRVTQGIRSHQAVQGELKVSDLVSPAELTHRPEQFSLQIDVENGTAVIYFTNDTGVRKEVGTYPYGGYNFDEDDFAFR